MGEQMTKPILTFTQLIVEMATNSKGFVQSSYVGDDGLVIYQTRDECIRHMSNLTRIGLLNSDLDTWISKNSPAFYCEKVIDYPSPSLSQLDKRDPADYWASKSLVKQAIESGKVLPYVDMIATRLLNNVAPERKRHSGQNTGKVEMLANQQRFNDPSSVILMEVVAPYIQRTLLSRQNPIDILPLNLKGRGLYLGRAGPEFFKDRVPTTLAIGAYLAFEAWYSSVKYLDDELVAKGKPSIIGQDSSIYPNYDPFEGIESRELNPQEQKILFVYGMIREGFHKPHDRSLSTRTPLEPLIELYDQLVSDGELHYKVPEGESPWDYVPLQILCKEFIQAYDEAGWYAGLDVDDNEEIVEISNDDAGERTLKDIMLSVNLPPYKEEVIYNRISRCAQFERTRDFNRRLPSHSDRGFISKEHVRELRRGWLKTNTNFVNLIYKEDSPDRDPEEQSRMRTIQYRLSQTLLNSHRERATLLLAGLAQELEELDATIENSIEEEAKEEKSNLTQPIRLKRVKESLTSDGSTIYYEKVDDPQFGSRDIGKIISRLDINPMIHRFKVGGNIRSDQEWDQELEKLGLQGSLIGPLGTPLILLSDEAEEPEVLSALLSYGRLKGTYVAFDNGIVHLNNLPNTFALKEADKKEFSQASPFVQSIVLRDYMKHGIREVNYIPQYKILYSKLELGSQTDSAALPSLKVDFRF